MTDKTNLEQRVVIRQDWEESELGWGVRPDGYSLHLSQEDWKAFRKEYWKGMPKEVPEEYSRESDAPYHVRVDKKTFQAIKNSKNGIRRY